MGDLYISKERVERDGVLVAWKGEPMSHEEAARRGLLADDSACSSQKEPQRRKAEKK